MTRLFNRGDYVRYHDNIGYTRECIVLEKHLTGESTRVLPLERWLHGKLLIGGQDDMPKIILPETLSSHIPEAVHHMSELNAIDPVHDDYKKTLGMDDSRNHLASMVLDDVHISLKKEIEEDVKTVAQFLDKTQVEFLKSQLNQDATSLSTQYSLHEKAEWIRKMPHPEDANIQMGGAHCQMVYIGRTDLNRDTMLLITGIDSTCGSLFGAIVDQKKDRKKAYYAHMKKEDLNDYELIFSEPAFNVSERLEKLGFSTISVQYINPAINESDDHIIAKLKESIDKHKESQRSIRGMNSDKEFENRLEYQNSLKNLVDCFSIAVKNGYRFSAYTLEYNYKKIEFPHDISESEGYQLAVYDGDVLKTTAFHTLSTAASSFVEIANLESLKIKHPEVMPYEENSVNDENMGNTLKI